MSTNVYDKGSVFDFQPDWFVAFWIVRVLDEEKLPKNNESCF